MLTGARKSYLPGVQNCKQFAHSMGFPKATGSGASRTARRQSSETAVTSSAAASTSTLVNSLIPSAYPTSNDKSHI